MFETRLTALHIDVARFASDDFNPFHDRHKWQRIAGNPFGGPIALGFQLGACGLEAVRDARRAAGGGVEPRYSTLQIRFIDAVRADDTLGVTVRGAEGAAPSTRFVIRRNGRAAALGALRGSDAAPAALADEAEFARALDQLPDRSVVPDGQWFLKRKFMLTANAKNFLAARASTPSAISTNWRTACAFRKSTRRASSPARCWSTACSSGTTSSPRRWSIRTTR